MNDVELLYQASLAELASARNELSMVNGTRTNAVHLDGVRFQRRCTEEEKQVLLETFVTCKSLMKENEDETRLVSKEISWFNLYSEG